MLIKVPTQEKRFGRLKSLDVLDRNFLMRMAPAVTDKPHTRPWPLKSLLNQGNEGSCTGFGSAHFLQAAPWMHFLTFDQARAIYLEAQRNDEWAGEDYEGSSVRGAMKAMLKLGLIQGGYVWAFTVADMIRHYQYRGPMVLGLDWYTGMMKTDKHGYIEPTGGIEGGHCVATTYFSASKNYWLGPNNWGLDWGTKGWWKMHNDAMVELIERHGGEAASGLEVQRH
jgi:hypothetical protein